MIAGVVAAALAALAAGCKQEAARPGSSSAGNPSTGPSADQVELSLLYGSEKKTWLDEQVKAFNASQTRTAGGKRIRVTARPIGSGEATAAILGGTQQPVVYSPASGAYVTLLNQAWQSRDGHTRPIAPAGEPLVLSPIVIAMWKPMAQVLGWPGKPIGWADILAVSRDPAGWGKYDHPEWGAMKLGHTHPEYSNSGLLSALAIAYAGARTTRGLTAAALPAVEPFMAGVEDAIVHYGTSTGFFGDKMIERGPSYLSAAVLYENLVIESYARQRSLDLVAIYPQEGTFWSDHPYCVLDAPWVTAEQRDAAGVFLAFLKARPQQERAMALGFRPVDPAIKIGAPIDAAHGVDPQQPQTLLEVPDGPTLEALLAAWRRTKKPADVVLVFDKSGSMAGRPLDEAKRGARAFLATLDDRDQVTLMFFDRQVYPPFGPRELGKARAELESRIDGISAGGDTALYDATLAAKGLLEARRKEQVRRIRAVLVMTDGADTNSSHSLDATVKGLHGEDGGIAVFTLGYGDEPNQAALGAIAKAGAGSFSRGDVDTIVAVFRDLASFF
ncbi:MAG TPA: VWA domain-containing protein [Kofleriaceae bacterium]|nr:VWA domain-containing protein [Kofleriaceae bacterium]